MQAEPYDRDPPCAGLPIGDHVRAAGSRLLAAAEPLAGLEPPPQDPVATTETPPGEPADEPAPPLVDGDGIFLAEAAPEFPAALGSGFAGGPSAPAPSGEIDSAQILRDRPDVYAAFYREFYGPSNDRNSPAWADRVGGETAEDYARYWYDAHGRYEGYTPGSGAQGAPAEGAVEGPVGRTTLDGIPLSKILADRPDVFQAFFTDYYGPNNDRHSDAWTQRVGGATVEDFANYWYNAHGRMEGYVPSRPLAHPGPDPAGAPDPVTDEDPKPLPSEDPSLDPWNHPAIYPDWRPPYPDWQPPGSAGAAAGSSPDPTDPAACRTGAHDDPLEEIAAMRSLFDDTVI